MKKIELFCLLIPILILQVNAQSKNEQCAFKLREAQRSYEEGKIEFIPGLLHPCLNSGLNKGDKQDAYKLLVLSYLFMDEVNKADSLMLKFLKEYPQYQITPTDPGNFEQLFKTYKTSPSIAIGISVGLNYSLPYYFERFSTGMEQLTSKEYYGTTGFHAGVQLYKPIADQTEICIEAIYSQTGYSTKTLTTPTQQLTTEEDISAILFPVACNYYFNRWINLKPFVKIGGIYQYSLLNTQSVTKNYIDGSGRESENLSNIEISEKRNSHSAYLLAGGGFRYLLPLGYLFLDASYHVSLSNIVNQSARYPNQNSSSQINELYWSYQQVDDNIRLNQLFISIGYVFPIYKVEKK